MQRRRWIWLFLVGLGSSLSLLSLSLPLGADTGQAAEAGKNPDAFLLKGTVADAKGPLAKKVVIISPIDAKSGRALTRYTVVNGQPGPMMNPKTTTDSKGAFSLTVPRGLFKDPPGCDKWIPPCTGYMAGQLSLSVSDDMGQGSYRSSLEATIVKYDEEAAAVDVGRIVLQPLK